VPWNAKHPTKVSLVWRANWPSHSSQALDSQVGITCTHNIYRLCFSLPALFVQLGCSPTRCWPLVQSHDPFPLPSSLLGVS
jgi:hypothetical protein